MPAIAIITARGGSKRIPRKNIKPFCGKPILVYSIEAALGSGLFDEVMVSTDDEEIAEVARETGASVPFFRSAATSDDYATTADVLMEVLTRYEERGQSFEMMCCLYPTAPFVTAEKLRRAAQAFAESDAGLLEPVVPFSYPPQRSFSLVDGNLQYNFPQHIRTRSQDLPTWYHDAGQFYFYRVAPFLAAARADAVGGYTLRTMPFVLDEMEVQDIDHLADWELAEMKYRMMVARLSNPEKRGNTSEGDV
ncbi:MAG: pseudaminic acid cytidylyltransferase [Selenomonas sp.]|uniref:pseudaminic acid cytidylyltransferase n=1 Tax=Selenomonas sp. TaxID=2053611 RepID=UPI0025CDAB08|nr:pseudaminic acid cytidylyltransferase [Selenomonas sp.]MCI6231458.1 pseudaminic acid cytidylyltransferase [Selenomonas sp.]